MIYHLASEQDWLDASTGSDRYAGGAQDRRDRFIHLLSHDQIVERAARHRAGEPSLLLLAVDGAALGNTFRWET